MQYDTWFDHIQRFRLIFSLNVLKKSFEEEKSRFISLHIKILIHMKKNSSGYTIYGSSGSACLDLLDL